MANVFLPIQHQGRTFTLATSGGGCDDLEDLGRDLWMGSRGIETQSALAASLGGSMAQTNAKGAFERWFDGVLIADYRIQAAAAKHPAFTGQSAKQAGQWIKSLERGSVAPSFQRLIDAVPLSERFGGKLGFGEAGSRLLPTALPTLGDIFGGRSKKEAPAAFGAESAELVARQLARLDGADAYIDEIIGFQECYLHHEGRWMTPLVVSKDEERPFFLRGKVQTAVWIPVSQALALSNDITPFDASDEAHLRGGLTAQDKEDLLAIARAVGPEHFFQGSAEARAWFEQTEMELASHAAPNSRKSMTL